MIQPSLKARIARDCRPRSRRTLRVAALAVAFVLFALFPLYAGNFVGQVLLMVGLFMLMGMGLNLEVGIAGLLDLGFVAFYAVGRLCNGPPHRRQSASRWRSSVCVGGDAYRGAVLGHRRHLFGIPVLKVRGDYLAVATMGLGEIVRVIVLSDAAAPLLAGAKGILQIPRPDFFGHRVLTTPVLLFYLALWPHRSSPPMWPGGSRNRALAGPGRRSATTRTWPRRSAST